MNTLEQKFNTLPSDYLKLMNNSQLIHLQDESSTFKFFDKNELMSYNIEMEVEEYFPNFLFIAENELSNILGFHLETHEVFRFHYDSAEEDGTLVAESFEGLLSLKTISEFF